MCAMKDGKLKRKVKVLISTEHTVSIVNKKCKIKI